MATNEIKNYGCPKVMNVSKAITEMQMGRRAEKDLCYGTRVAAMKAFELYAKEHRIHNMMTMQPTFNLKQSVVPESCEEVTSILPIDKNNILFGTGSTENEIHMLNVPKMREANYEYKKSCRSVFGRMSKPRTNESIQRLTKLLPRTAEMQWDGGVKGLTMNTDGTLIMCSSRNGKDLTFLKIDRSEKYSEERAEINEERSTKEQAIYTWADAIIYGWNKNPTLPKHFKDENGEDFEDFALYSKGGLLTRFGQVQAHTRNITGTCWYGNEQAISVGDDGFMIYYDVDETKSVEERSSWPTKMVSITKKKDQSKVVRTSNRIHQREILSSPTDRNDRARLIGVNKINGSGKIVTCTARAKIIITDGVDPKNPDVRSFPREHLPINNFLPYTKLLAAQDVHQSTGEVVVATPYHIMLLDHRREKPTAVGNVYDTGKVGLRNGPVTTISADCGIINIGHKSGNIRMLDRRTCEIINDGKEVYNIEPSWLADRLDKAPDSGPFDIYPVRAIARQNHKIIAGGGPVTCNGEYWPMAALSVFE